MAAISVFRSQSFLQTVSSSIEREATQKRISAQAGLQLRKVHDLSSTQVLSKLQTFNN